MREYENFTYGEDWAISFTIVDIDEELTFDSPADPKEMPEQFLNSDDIRRNEVLQFSIFAWKHLKFRIDVLQYNGLYLNHMYLF